MALSSRTTAHSTRKRRAPLGMNPTCTLIFLAIILAAQLPSASSLSTPSSSAAAASASTRSAIAASAPSAPPIRRVAVIGAGIAGLSLAHALENSEGCAARYVGAVGENGPSSSRSAASSSSLSPFGIDVTTFDSRPSLDFTAGAGVQLNGGMSILNRINPAVHASVVDAALPLFAIRSRTRPWFESSTDPYSTLLEIELEKTIKKAGGDAADQLIVDGQVQAFTIMRGALQEVLVDQLPPPAKERLHFGKALVGIEPSDDSDDGGVMCLFDDDSTYGPFDMVVGCDGIKSAVKEHIERGQISQDPKARERRSAIYSGIRIKFAVQDGGPDDSDTAGGRGGVAAAKKESAEFKQYFGDGMYGLSGVFGAGVGRKPTRCSYIILRDEDYIGPFKKKQQDGSRQTETTKEEVAVVSENADWTQDVRSGSREECKALMAKARIPDIELGPVVDRSDRFFELGVYFHNPFSLSGWSREVKGSDGTFCVLCGDSAHAMPPFLGQGANQAIQDAYCLATKIFEHNANWEELSRDTAAAAAAAPSDLLGDNDTTVSEEVADRSLKALLREYERTRWGPTTSITAKAAFLGYLECGGEGFLSKFRDAFFFTLGKVGVASKVFLDAATPKV